MMTPMEAHKANFQESYREWAGKSPVWELPFVHDTEMGLLATLASSADSCCRIIRRTNLEVDHFFDGDNRQLFIDILQLHASNRMSEENLLAVCRGEEQMVCDALAKQDWRWGVFLARRLQWCHRMKTLWMINDIRAKEAWLGRGRTAGT